MEYVFAAMAALFFVALAVLGPLFGADSRDGRDWRPTGPTRTPGPRPPGRIRAFWRRQVRLWERVLTAHQPWRGQGDPLRWRRDGDRWILDGSTAPADDAGPVSDAGALSGNAFDNRVDDGEDLRRIGS